MRTIYIVRHCQAEGQAREAKLTESGRRQAERLAHFFLDKNIDYIVSSPFERAYQTIAPLAERTGIEVVLDERLAERVLSDVNQPDWREQLRKTFEDLDLCYAGGESSSTAMDRGIRAVTEALNREYRNIVFVSHGNLISLLLKYFEPRIGFKEWEALSNPDVFRLTFAGEPAPTLHRVWEE
ncbi:histidine phosphatase family protein [Paenibacillus glufosinatiresistens]|uniref:histidine phosphatase family protein n=1 Tax=Paenibacillus glufosinatiresistens TaxID=3070657 RepID=UPI00286DBE46|nr:histidine phosphatase family protein [Paenibacillus sp. YX.27]